MVDVFLLIIAAIWVAGACWRIYRQAHYYQLEEYMSGRFLSWVASERKRWLPNRPLIALLAGVMFTLLLVEADDGILMFIIGTVAAVAAIYPARVTEVKKAFRATARAKRLLAASFVIALALAIVMQWLVSQVRIEGFLELRFVLAAVASWLPFMLAPLLLVLGNVLMMPVEAFLRRRFVQRARGVLAEIDPVVIGITGSYGKTSTKHYLAHILNGRYKTYATPKSYNTLMGVCIAINNDLAHDYSAEYFIAEMGAYVPGEIEQLCDLTHPRIGIIIEVGPQHLERFGSLDNIARAKYELIKNLPADGAGVFNWDNPYVREMYERDYPTTRIAVSREIDPATAPPGGPRFVATAIHEALDGLSFILHDTQIDQSAEMFTPLLGIHNVTNILLATAVAIHEGMSLADVARRVRTLQPAESRLVSRTTPQGITIINDAYSANPIGIIGALRTLSLHDSTTKLLITPGMVELGPLHESENRKLGELAAAHATEVILIGPKQTAPIQDGLLGAGFPMERIHVMESLSEAQAWYQDNLQPGDTVLFLNDLPDTYS
ncbi:MAG: UDP-N-acetylmuramoyl-tripeptide--D-alanyl-D-alanine ligase, partial [Anaerolineae bacterium]|nr:UDP-N-acetylmuramoyl-tripeptide--D-alanyl-D-alanine ligase [Anaerolineae bacterium]